MSGFGDILESKCMNFSVRIVNMCRFLAEEKKEHRIADQLFRSGTSIGANVAEAQCAISRNDFIAKLYIALKESNESIYWIDLLFKTQCLTKEQYVFRHLAKQFLIKQFRNRAQPDNSKLKNQNT